MSSSEGEEEAPTLESSLRSAGKHLVHAGTSAKTLEDNITEVKAQMAKLGEENVQRLGAMEEQVGEAKSTSEGTAKKVAALENSVSQLSAQQKAIVEREITMKVDSFQKFQEDVLSILKSQAESLKAQAESLKAQEVFNTDTRTFVNTILHQRDEVRSSPRSEYAQRIEIPDTPLEDPVAIETFAMPEERKDAPSSNLIETIMKDKIVQGSEDEQKQFYEDYKNSPQLIAQGLQKNPTILNSIEPVLFYAIGIGEGKVLDDVCDCMEEGATKKKLKKKMELISRAFKAALRMTDAHANISRAQAPKNSEDKQASE